jgi:outer membrane receptor protein involved in Fe transport
MAKTYLLLFFIIIALPNQLFSQINISGQIVNQNNKPVELIEIQLQNKDSVLVKSELTNTEGKFAITIEKGEYLLFVKQLGTVLYRQKINVDQDHYLGEIRIIENQQQLEEVVITKKKKLIERKVDRLIFNVENSISASGGDAIDALKLTPRVKVQNEQISMIGKSGMLVMIDDRLIQLSGDDLINYLKTLKADDIKSIEVITNPPAKYNAEGNSGLINIKFKKAKNDAWNASVRTLYQQASYPTGVIGTGYNLQKNKITLITNFTYSDGSNAPFESSIINYPNITWKEENKRRDFSKSLSGRIGLDYKISEKISTGFIFNIVKSNPKINDNINSLILNSNTNVLDSLIKTKAKNIRERLSNSLNYHLIYKIDSIGKKLTFDFDYFDYNLDSKRLFETNSFLNDNTFIQNSFTSANNIGVQKINNYSFNLDMEHPTKWINLNYGLKTSFIKTDNEFDFYNLSSGISIFDPTQSNHFNYKENTQSIYFSAQKEISKKWDSKIGLRLENTIIEGYSVTLSQLSKSKYTKLFPTAYVSYNPNENNSFSINYGRRISRPNYNLLNPFKWISSPYSYSEGNPFLQPAFAQNIEIEYTYKNNLITSFYFSNLEDGFEQVTIVNPITNITQITPKNFLINKMFGVNQTIILEPFKFLKTNFYTDIYYSSTKSTIPVTLNYLKGWNGEFSISNDFILNKNKTFLFNVSYSYTTKGVDNLDRNSQFSQLDASLKLMLMNKKLIMSLYANDILSSSRVTYASFSNNIKTSYRNYYDNRYFRISLSYKFGNNKLKVERRNLGNEEEKNRAK